MKTRKAFLFGFLMLAFVTLLSGMVQSKNRVAETTPVYALDNSPPAVLPTNVFTVTANFSVPASTWYCTLNPGYVFNASVTVSDGILYTDMPSMKCNIYYTIEKPDYELSTLSGYAKDIDKYPFKATRAPQQYFATYQVINSVPTWIYRQPRDGLRQSWQA